MPWGVTTHHYYLFCLRCRHVTASQQLVHKHCGEMNSGLLHHWGCIREVMCAITSALPGWLSSIHSLSWSTLSVRKSQLFQANVTAVWPFSVLLSYVSSSWSILSCLRCQEYDTPTYLIYWAVISKVQSHVCAIKKAAPVSSLVKTTQTSLFNHIISVFAHWKKKWMELLQGLWQ